MTQLVRLRRPRVLALDLESTLVASALRPVARPGLYAFLEWAADRFERVVLFTAVRADVARDVLRGLVEHGDAPRWAEGIEIVRWEGLLKDLAFVGGARVDEIILVEDQPRYVVPEQRAQWVPIADWPAPHAGADRGLERVRAVIEARLAATGPGRRADGAGQTRRDP